MVREETKTFPITGNSLTAQFQAALTNKPEWAQSFTTAMITSSRVRVTYYGDTSRGVDLQSATNYVERHN